QREPLPRPAAPHDSDRGRHVHRPERQRACTAEARPSGAQARDEAERAGPSRRLHGRENARIPRALLATIARMINSGARRGAICSISARSASLPTLLACYVRSRRRTPRDPSPIRSAASTTLVHHGTGTGWTTVRDSSWQVRWTGTATVAGLETSNEADPVQGL